MKQMTTKTAIEILRSEFWGHKYGFLLLMQAAEIAIPFLKSKGWQLHYGSGGICTCWEKRYHRQNSYEYDKLENPFWLRRGLIQLDNGKYARPDEGLPF